MRLIDIEITEVISERGSRGQYKRAKGTADAEAARKRGRVKDAVHVRRGRYLVDQTINNATATGRTVA